MSDNDKNEILDKKIFLLQGILDIGEIAYVEEQERKKLLIEQSNSMIVVISLIITFLGFITSFINNKIATNYLQVFYSIITIIFIILFASVICAVLVQWRTKYMQFSDAEDFFNEVKSNEEKFLDKSVFIQKKIANYGKTTKSIKKNNQKRTILLKISHILLFLSMLIILLCVIAVLIHSFY